MVVPATVAIASLAKMRYGIPLVVPVVIMLIFPVMDQLGDACGWLDIVETLGVVNVEPKDETVEVTGAFGACTGLARLEVTPVVSTVCADALVEVVDSVVEPVDSGVVMVPTDDIVSEDPITFKDAVEDKTGLEAEADTDAEVVGT